jgi:acyl-CoA dehydrogenase
MDFELSEDLKMIKSLAHDFVVNELRPLERDLLGRSASSSDARATLAAETEAGLVRKAKDAGLWGAAVPEEFGGVGLGILAGCVIEEELAQTVVPFDFGDVSPILFECDAGQRSRYFVPVFNKERTAIFALLEPSAHRDVDPTTQRKRPAAGLISARAQKEGQNYVLNGVKTAIGKPGPNSFAVVFALVEETKPTCFLVDAGASGFDIKANDSGRARVPLLLSFTNCRVAASNRLGEEGKAFALGSKWLPSRRIVRGARVVGAAQRLLEEVTVRAQTTQWFGKPVSERPSVRSALAEIATDIHACRLLVYEAAWKSDENRPVRNEASMVKLFAIQMLRNVASRVSHIYGGPNNLPANGPCSNAMTNAEGGLTAELQTELIAREILKGLRT